jgi:hypothetical protein
MGAVELTEQRTAEPESFELVYQGPDVDYGTMSARELTEVMLGITRLFSTVAHERELGDQYELRVKDIDHNSFHLIFDAIAFTKANPVSAGVLVAGAGVGVTAATNLISGAYRIITDIGAMVTAKKKAKGERFARLSAEFMDGEVQVAAPDGLIVLTKEQYELLLSQRVDRQLAQIVSPLLPRRIDRFQMRRSEIELATVEATQRDYFDYREVTEEKSREGTEIVGTLNSLTKTSLRGTFYTIDGIHVPYRYTGGDIAQLLNGFSSREPLRVRGHIKYGSDGIPVSVEVQDIEFVQRSFNDK